MRIIEIDGNDFHTLEEFYAVFSQRVLGTTDWGHNLDAFNDVLSWIETPDGEPFTLVWHNAAKSQQDFGYAATAAFFRQRLPHSHNPEATQNQLNEALREEGDTIWDWLLEIFDDNRCYVRVVWQ